MAIYDITGHSKASRSVKNRKRDKAMAEWGEE